MIEHRRAGDRFCTEQPGITTWQSFSAGAHYDPRLLSFGPIIGVDEHVVAPGAGFDWHGHRGVHIASWVLAGVLRHESSAGEVCDVRPGRFLVQSTGTGIRHRETNPSDTVPLRFVQVTVLGDAAAPARVVAPPVRVGPASIDLRRGLANLAGGDVEIDGKRFVLALGGGDLLVVRVGT